VASCSTRIGACQAGTSSRATLSIFSESRLSRTFGSRRSAHDDATGLLARVHRVTYLYMLSP
jgi:hypothetical protein